MKLKPLQKLICRTPAFSINSTMADVLPELKKKIRESSPAFFDFIEPLTANQIDQLSEKIKFTLWKYANRAKYRSTPFGSFAAVSTIPLLSNPKQIIIDEQIECIHYVDWSHKDEFVNHLEKSILPETVFLRNSSIYLVSDKIRYIRVKDGQHELAEVDNIPELDALLLACIIKITAKEIYPLMLNKFSMRNEEVDDLLQQLLALQLIMSDQCANITGRDYFERLGIEFKKSPTDYIIAKRKVSAGGFDVEILKKLPDYISFIAQQFPLPLNSDLRIFKIDFLHRFEHQEVSLAVVMDPEIGIGYGNLAQSHQYNALISEIKTAKKEQSSDTLSYSPFHAFLLNKIIAGEAIKLEKFQAHTTEIPKYQVPNTLSFILHLFENQPVLAYGGGCTANALIGRFTMGNEEIEAIAKEITELETDANLDIIFFDIAYQAEKRVDNVNRRKLVYPHELPILSWSTTQEPLDFSDILVSVVEDEVILRSAKLGKRLIPRIPSAYNYTRSDLAAYRFLCDIQSQGLTVNMSFNLTDLFPKLNFYPRVSFHDIIISPAKWLIPLTLYNNPQTHELMALQKWLKDHHINFRFKAGYADATLCFNPTEEDDLLAFLNFSRQQKGDVYISEALISDSSCISDQHGARYLPQYIINYSHQEPLYKDIPKAAETISKTKNLQMPGGDWLYFEIYCHPMKSNAMLIQHVHHFMKGKQTALKKWFFIRYAQPSAHLRLRLHLKNNADGFKIIEALKLIIEPEMQLGIVTDFKIKTYKREMARYGAKRMDLIERFFMTDSQYVLYLLKKTTIEDQLMASSLNLISIWLENCIPLFADQMRFTSLMANSFAAEMNLAPAHFKKINANFNLLKSKLSQLQIIPNRKILKTYHQLFDKILQTTTDQNDLEGLLSDLIHMHVNRLFNIDQRMYETVLYHYLLRILQMRKAMINV